VKWHLPHASTGDGEHSGRTSKIPLKDHKVLYSYETHIPVRMTIDKAGLLQETLLECTIIHEPHHSEKLSLGVVKLNIAEYIEASEQGVEDEGVVRRYLMQESKINSTLKIGIYLKQVEGDRQYSCPPLRVAPVFSGIAGLVVGEVEKDSNEGNTSRTQPALNTQGVSQVAGDELRELYRRTIAANWTCLPGELSADRVIEDIFSGSDGWLAQPPSSGNSSQKDKHSDDENRTIRSRGQHARKKSDRLWNAGFYSRPGSTQDIKRHSKDSVHVKRDERPNIGHGIRGRGSFESQARSMGGEVEQGSKQVTNEYDELDIRDDLRSWMIPT
jgi:hypothetical protein